jgi:uncharacterized tellurite resistance protein B-like protein
MGTVRDVISAMTDVLTLTKEVDSMGVTLKEFAQEIRQDLKDHEKRLIRIETMVEMSKSSKQIETK